MVRNDGGALTLSTIVVLGFGDPAIRFPAIRLAVRAEKGGVLSNVFRNHFFPDRLASNVCHVLNGITISVAINENEKKRHRVCFSHVVPISHPPQQKAPKAGKIIIQCLL